MGKRNLDYEKKFRSYLFSGDYERHKKIVKNLNLVPSTESTRKAFKGVPKRGQSRRKKS